METFVNVILEIIKISVPALIVFFTVLHLLKNHTEKEYQLKLLENKQSNKKTTIPMRLQAYERLSLFCERIAIPSLLLRLKEQEQTSAELRLKLLLTIQQEFEYNITQQVYVSEQLWQILKIAREDTMTIINSVAENLDAKSPSSELSNSLLTFLDKQPFTTLDKALIAIKKEATLLL
ncbi:MAG: hypothetical protein AAFZ15_30875 [Bacteroidota bacterium]